MSGNELVRDFKCKVCGGGNLKQLGNGKVECLSCGEKFIVDDNLSGEVRNLLNTADVLLSEMDFSKAKNFYIKAIEKDENAVEAYFGALCAKYGIEYVKEKSDSGIVYKPTCHRCSHEDVFNDEFAKKLLKLIVGDELENDYKNKLTQINNIRKQIDELAKKESPYDVFICFKAEEEIHGRTVKTDDYILGNQIYNDLIRKNYKVFFSPETLKGKGGENYEPLIFNALETSAVMLVVCTENREFLESTWVKNEWSRFLEMMNRNDNKKLIPIFKETDKMSISDFPQEFIDKKLQALDSGDYDFSKSLLESIQNAKNSFLRGIGGTIKRRDLKEKANFNVDVKLEARKIDKKKFVQNSTQIVIPQKTENLLRMAKTPLDAEKYDKANDLYCNILKDEPNQYLALWGKILSQSHCKNDEMFKSFGALRLTDYESFEKLLSISPTEDAKKYYDLFYHSFLNNCDDKKIDFNKTFDECIKWADAGQTEYISVSLFDKAAAIAKVGLNKALSDKLLDASLKLLGENDADVFINRNNEIAKYWSEKGSFDIAKEYLEKIFKIAPYQKEANLHMFLCDLRIADDSIGKLDFAIKNIDFMDKFEKLVEYDCDIDVLFNNLIKVAYLKIKNNKIEFGEKIFERIAEIMQSILSDEDYTNNLLQFADLFLLKGKFDLAKKYYTQLLSLNTSNVSAHWGMLKVAYERNSDYQLLLLPHKDKSDWTTAVEFSNVIGACISKADSDKYLDFQFVYEAMDKDTKAVIKVAQKQSEDNCIVPNIIGNVKQHIKSLQDHRYDINIVNDFEGQQMVEATSSKTLANNLTPEDKKTVYQRLAIIIGLMVFGVANALMSIPGAGSIDIKIGWKSWLISAIGAVGAVVLYYLLKQPSPEKKEKSKIQKGFAAYSIWIILVLGTVPGMILSLVPYIGFGTLGLTIIAGFIINTKCLKSKTKKGNVISLILTITCIVFALGTCGITWSVKYANPFIVKDGTVISINGTALMGKDTLTIPAIDKKSGKPIYKIGSNILPKDAKIETIIISEGITEIGEDAFENIETLKYVYLPNGLKRIGKNAFGGAGGMLKGIIIPDSVNYIGEYAFNARAIGFQGSKENVDKVFGSQFKGYAGFSSVAYYNVQSLYFDEVNEMYLMKTNQNELILIEYCGDKKAVNLSDLNKDGNTIKCVVTAAFSEQERKSLIVYVPLSVTYARAYAFGYIDRVYLQGDYKIIKYPLSGYEWDIDALGQSKNKTDVESLFLESEFKKLQNQYDK